MPKPPATFLPGFALTATLLLHACGPSPRPEETAGQTVPPSPEVAPAPPSEHRTLVHLSPVYTVDREYRSMMGPMASEPVGFPDLEEGDLVWITGIRSEMVAADGTTPMPQEFMCHTNMDMNGFDRSRSLGLPMRQNRMFTLSQGQLEIAFPQGFGIPVRVGDGLTLDTQVLQLNPTGASHEVRHRVSIDYLHDREAPEDMQALYVKTCYGMKVVADTPHVFNVEDGESLGHGPGCLPGEPADGPPMRDSLGRDFTPHWIVKPGREVNRTRVTDLLRLDSDVRVHAIAVHLHPFAESLELRDVTTGTSIFRSEAKGFDDRIGLERVDAFESVEGVPVFADHEYELVSTYDNTTSDDQDSMAVMLLYVADGEFQRPERR